MVCESGPMNGAEGGGAADNRQDFYKMMNILMLQQ